MGSAACACPRRMSTEQPSSDNETEEGFELVDEQHRPQQNWTRVARTLHRLFQRRRYWGLLGNHLKLYRTLRDV